VIVVHKDGDTMLRLLVSKTFDSDATSGSLQQLRMYLTHFLNIVNSAV
jgi:hypothetical protein